MLMGAEGIHSPFRQRYTDDLRPEKGQDGESYTSQPNRAGGFRVCYVAKVIHAHLLAMPGV
ncbi:rCG53756 [Rattus norvegicus]|uniref:RCG53756 n=1 Tax=Rattus norvegicus TaxID=10116 RepID=A6J9R0_RAT|nr:rCG53756 [Rattus norvegicus]